MSPATSPGPTRSAARPCTHAAAAAASNADTPRARNAATIPVSTSPVPAVASAGLPVTLSDDPSRSEVDPRALGSAMTVVGPLSSTTAPERVGESPRGRDPVGADRLAGETGVLAVVRREHRGRTARRSRHERREVAVERVQPVGVEHERHRRLAATSVHTARRAPASAPRPGPSASAPNAIDVGEHRVDRGGREIAVGRGGQRA